jgi:hypothetical protein
VSKKSEDIIADDDTYWAEIFDSIDLQYLPLEYLDRIILTFEDGTIWDIDIKDSRIHQTIEQIEDQLDEFFEEYDTQIEAVDYRLDLERVKKDLSKRVFRFLKLNK